MDSKTWRETDLPLAHRITQESTSAETAAAALAQWDAIRASLTPILGPLGFASLCKRSLHLAAAHHPWLANVPNDAPALADGETLRAAITQQDNDEAAEGALAFFLALHDLVVTLIGVSLTERLLRMAWAQPSRVPHPAEPHP